MNMQVQAAPTEAAPRPSEIQGVVDNIAAGRVFGWAWNPSEPAERVTIELRLGQQIVAQTLAAHERADLKGAGIGDGCHAFEHPIGDHPDPRHASIKQEHGAGVVAPHDVSSECSDGKVCKSISVHIADPRDR